jgi:hypothetical protein
MAQGVVTEFKPRYSKKKKEWLYLDSHVIDKNNPTELLERMCLNEFP